MRLGLGVLSSEARSNTVFCSAFVFTPANRVFSTSASSSSEALELAFSAAKLETNLPKTSLVTRSMKTVLSPRRSRLSKKGFITTMKSFVEMLPLVAVYNSVRKMSARWKRIPLGFLVRISSSTMARIASARSEVQPALCAISNALRYIKRISV